MKEPSASYSLPPVMTIDTIEEVAKGMREISISEKACVTLDASRVESITTPGAQLFVALEKSLQALGGTLRITGGRESFLCALKDLGFERLIASPT